MTTPLGIPVQIEATSGGIVSNIISTSFLNK
jgi:hypothetical protein